MLQEFLSCFGQIFGVRWRLAINLLVDEQVLVDGQAAIFIADYEVLLQLGEWVRFRDTHASICTIRVLLDKAYLSGYIIILVITALRLCYDAS